MKYVWACFCGLAVFGPAAIFFLLRVIDQWTGYRYLGALVSHLPGEGLEGVATYGVAYFLAFLVASLAGPVLLSAVLLRQARFVATSVLSSFGFAILAFAGLAAMVPSDRSLDDDLHKDYVRWKEFNESVQLDTVGYQLLDPVPEHFAPPVGTGYGRLRVDVQFAALQPGDVRITTTYGGHAGGQSPRKIKTVHLESGMHSVPVEFTDKDFDSAPSAWVDLHYQKYVNNDPGWHCWVEVTIERKAPTGHFWEQPRWSVVDEKKFNLAWIEEHPLTAPTPPH